MAEGPIIQPADLLATWNQWPANMQNDSQLAIAIIKLYLGEQWLLRHVAPETQSPGPLTIRGAIAEQKLARVRIVDLAEMLFNLCRIRGFADCINRMKTADSPEPSLAELHIGKMLFANGWPFSFVVPRGKRGDNYDLRISYKNMTVCADVKCKIESQVPDSKSITNTLKHSRTQLPADKAGVFFVKIPQTWMIHKGWEKVSVQGAADFFSQGSGRVTSVAFYLEPIHLFGNIAQQAHHFYEIANPRRRFGQDLDWHFFQRWRPSTNAGWNALPSNYVRLFDFPNGLLGVS